MKRLLFILALAGCNQTQINTPVRVFDRPSDVALACNQVNENGFVFDARPISDCTPERIDELSKDANGNQRLLPSGAVNAPGLSAMVVQSSRGELAHVDVPGRRVVDLQRPVPGFGFLPVGDLPEHVRVSGDGCVAATANTASCDVAVVDLPVLYNMPFLPFRDGGVPEGFGSNVVRRLTPTVQGKPLGARPAWIEFSTYTEPALRGWEPGGVPGQCIARTPPPSPSPAMAPYHAWVALPGCELVVEVDLSGPRNDAAGFTPAEVLRAIRVTRTGAEVVSDLTTLSCPSECSGAPMEAPVGSPEPVDVDAGTRLPTTQAQPSTVAVDADLRIDLGRLFIGDRVSDRITVVPFDVSTGALGTPHQLTLDASALGVEVVRISPRSEAGKFLYAVARDATVRVVDLDRETECETNPDPRAFQDLPESKDPLFAARRFGCFPVGDPATPRRAPLATSPGITLPGLALPKDVAFVHTDVPPATATNIAPPAAGPSTLVGDYAWIISSDGRATLVNIFDACPSPNQPRPRMDGTFPPACSQESVERSQQDAFLHPGHPLPMALDRLSHRPRGGVSRFFLPTNPSDNVGQPRLTDEINPFQVTIGGLARGNESDLPTLQQEPVPVPPGFPSLPAAASQRFISFYDPEKARNETWTLSWEGALPGTQRTLGAIVFSDANGPLQNPKLLDSGAAFCSRGVMAGDKVAMTGCDSDADCAFLDLCIRDPNAPIGVTQGMCLRRDDQARLTELCGPFLRGMRRYRILSAKQGAPINYPMPTPPPASPPPEWSGVSGGVSDILELGEIYQPEHPVDTHTCVADADCQDVKVPDAAGASALDTSCLRDADGVNRCLRACGGNGSCGANYQCLKSRFGDQRCMRVPLDQGLLDACMPELQAYEVRVGEAFMFSGSSTSVFVDSQANPQTRECEIPPESSEFARLHQSRIPIQPAALCPAELRGDDPLAPLPADFLDPVSGVATNVCLLEPVDPAALPKADRVVHFENPFFGINVKIPGTTSLSGGGQGMDMGAPDLAPPGNADLGPTMGGREGAPVDIVPPDQFALSFSLVGSGFPLGVALAVDVQAQQPRYATTSPDGQTVFIVDEGKQNTGVGLRGQLLKLSSSAVAIDRGFQVR